MLEAPKRWLAEANHFELLLSNPRKVIDSRLGAPAIYPNPLLGKLKLKQANLMRLWRFVFCRIISAVSSSISHVARMAPLLGNLYAANQCRAGGWLESFMGMSRKGGGVLDAKRATII